MTLICGSSGVANCQWPHCLQRFTLEFVLNKSDHPLLSHVKCTSWASWDLPRGWNFGLKGNVAPCSFWLKRSPKVKSYRPLGKVTPCRLLLKLFPKVRLCRLLGKLTPSRLWSKKSFNVKLCKLPGNVTPSRLSVKLFPNVELCRLLGKVTSSRLWMKPIPKVKLWRLLGKATPCRLWLKLYKRWRFADCLARKLLQGFDWNYFRKLSFADRLLGNLPPVSLWLNIIPKASKGRALQTAWQGDSIQALIKINSEDRCLNCSVSWLLAGFGKLTPVSHWLKLSPNATVSSADCLAGSLLPDSHWKRRRKWSFWGSEGGGTNTHHLLSPVSESDPAMNIFPQTQGSWRRSAMQYDIRWNIRAWKGHSLKCPAPAMFGWVWAVKPGAASLAPFSGSCSWFPCGPLAQSGTSEGQAAAFTIQAKHHLELAPHSHQPLPLWASWQMFCWPLRKEPHRAFRWKESWPQGILSSLSKEGMGTQSEHWLIWASQSCCNLRYFVFLCVKEPRAMAGRRLMSSITESILRSNTQIDRRLGYLWVMK